MCVCVRACECVGVRSFTDRSGVQALPVLVVLWDFEQMSWKWAADWQGTGVSNSEDAEGPAHAVPPSPSASQEKEVRDDTSAVSPRRRSSPGLMHQHPQLQA